MERVAEHDDVLPLRYPVITKSGEKIIEVTIKAGQVRKVVFWNITDINIFM